MDLNSFLKIFRRTEPIPFWAYRLECPVCRMSFGTAEMHYKYALGQIEYKHQRCIK